MLLLNQQLGSQNLTVSFSLQVYAGRQATIMDV